MTLTPPGVIVDAIRKTGQLLQCIVAHILGLDHIRRYHHRGPHSSRPLSYLQLLPQRPYTIASAGEVCSPDFLGSVELIGAA